MVLVSFGSSQEPSASAHQAACLGPGYPAEMAEDFETTPANLSNHLICLRECGLVTATAEGRWVRYELADSQLVDGLRILTALDLPGTCQ